MRAGFASVCPAPTKRSHDWIKHCAMVEPVALLALALDAAIGWPQAIYRRVGHPVGIFARAILWCELRWNLQSRTQISRRVSGGGTVLMLVALAGGVGAVLQDGLLALAGPWAWPLIEPLAVGGSSEGRGVGKEGVRT